MARRLAVVRREEALRVHEHAVHAEVGRDPVGDLEPDAVLVGVVADHVDEPRCDDTILRVDRRPPDERSFADRHDRAGVDADVRDPVVARLGVDHPAAGDDLVEDVVGRKRCGRRGSCEARRLRRRRVGARVHLRHDCRRSGLRHLAQRQRAGRSEPEGEQEPPTLRREELVVLGHGVPSRSRA